jgi:hypothetical protein
MEETNPNPSMEKNLATEPVAVRITRLALVALYLLAILINLRSFPYATWGGDTDDYLYMAEKPISNPEFYAGPRPWATSLLYKILGAGKEIETFTAENGVVRGSPNATAVMLAQTLIHALSWIALAWMAASMLSTAWMRAVLLGLILAISLCPAVYAWNRILMSESLSISLMVLLIALWLWGLKGWQWHKVILVCAVSLLWVFTRETNVYIILGMAILLLLVGLIQKNQRVCLAIAIFYLLAVAASSSLSDLRNRWATPLANVIFQRILPDSQALAYFQAQGMPSGAEILALQGQYSCANNCTFFKEAQYAPFRQWLLANGRRVYLGYLLTNLPHSLTAPLADLADLTGSSLKLSQPQAYIPPLPTWFSNILYFQGFGAALFWAAFLLAIPVLVFQVWKFNPAVFAVLVLLLMAYPHAFLIYHGDSMGISRHAIQFNIQVRLTFWLLCAILLDWLLNPAMHKSGIGKAKTPVDMPV